MHVERVAKKAGWFDARFNKSDGAMYVPFVVQNATVADPESDRAKVGTLWFPLLICAGELDEWLKKEWNPAHSAIKDYRKIGDVANMEQQLAFAFESIIIKHAIRPGAEAWWNFSKLAGDCINRMAAAYDLDGDQGDVVVPYDASLMEKGAAAVIMLTDKWMAAT